MAPFFMAAPSLSQRFISETTSPLLLRLTLTYNLDLIQLTGNS